MKNILLPTDFSDNSRNAIIYALDLFRGQEVTFHFLNVQKPAEYTTDDLILASSEATIFEAVIHDNKTRLKSFVTEFKEAYSEEKYTFEDSVDFDALTDAIKQIIAGKDIDLIIMGTNGATGASEVLFGSNTLKVIRKVDYPVLAIPEGYKFTKMDNVLFSTHTCKDLQDDKAKAFRDIADIFKPLLHILKIKTGEESTHNCDTCLLGILKTDKFKSYNVRGVPAPMAIDTFVQLVDVDMHAHFVERRSFLDRFIFGSETAKISYKTRKPLLLLHK